MRTPIALLTLAFAVAAPAAALGTLSIGAAPGTVPGDGSASTTITAGTPVIEDGVFEQQITQSFDPTRVRITNPNAITAPSGWTVAFSSDGASFSATAPTTQAGWDAIRAVRATGPVDSNGTTGEGYQVAQRDATVSQPPSSAFSGSGGGDGWDVTFDENGRVFNIFHHAAVAAVDCHNRADGSLCAGFATPLSLQTTIDGVLHRFMSPHQSRVWVDPQTDHMWIPTAVQNQAKVGFACVDVSLTPAYPGGEPRWCDTPFVNLKSHNAGTTVDSHDGLAVVGREVYMRINTTDELLCLDLDANGGAGGACAGQPYAVGARDQAIALSGKLYFPSGAGMGCFDPATKAWCASWPIDGGTGLPSVSLTTSGLDNHQSYDYPYELPDANGDVIGVCFLFASSTGRQCVNPAGVTTGDGGPGAKITASVPYPNSLATDNIAWHNKEPVRSGTRIYWIEGAYNTNEELRCWDAAVNAGAGGICAGGGWPSATENRGYSVTVDPENPLCVWTNGDPGQIKVWDYDGTSGCEAPLPSVTFEPEVIVPRMACAGDGRVRRWVEFRLVAPSDVDYTTAVLSVRDSSGAPIAGFQNLPITADDNGDRIVDLSGLSVVTSGASPDFEVIFTGRTVAGDVTARVVAVGDAPQLCLDLEPYPVACPAAPLSHPQPLPAPPVTNVTGIGSATLISDSSQMVFGPEDAAITQGARDDADCLGAIGGVVAEVGGGDPLPGVEVELTDGAGTVLERTTTAADGSYRFARLAAGVGYRVRFVTPGAMSPDGPTDGSPTVDRTVAAGSDLTVDGAYALLPTAPDRSATAVQGTTLRFDPFAADGDSPAARAGTGATLVPADTRLCDTDEVAPACTLQVRTTAQGVWRVEESGQITFTPRADFVGAADPQAYAVITSLGDRAHGTLQATLVAAPPVPTPPATPPAVLPAPVALADFAATRVGVPVAVDVLANDTPGLVAGTLRLWDGGSWVQQLSVAGQGTWQVTASGITFTPAPGFSGSATAVRYRVANAAGVTTEALVRVHVAPGGTPYAAPDAKQGPRGVALPFIPLANDLDGARMNPTTLRLRNPRTGAWVMRLVVAGEGTWTVTGSQRSAEGAGSLVFMPLPDFAGRSTPVRYRAGSDSGETISSTAIATILADGAALQLRAAASPGVLRVGGVARITLRVMNPGSTADTATRACVRLPRALRPLAAPGVLVSGQTVCVRVGDLAVGAEAVRSVRAVARTAAGRVGIAAWATADGGLRATDATAVRIRGARPVVTG